MRSTKSHLVGAACMLSLAGNAWGDPLLESLWPNADGYAWIYDLAITDSTETFETQATLQLNGTVTTAGGTAQVLDAWHDLPANIPSEIIHLPPLLRSVWRARPDLREKILAEYASRSAETGWAPLLLHGGYFMKKPEIIEMWQPTWNHSTWTYLKTPLIVGAQFVHQLVPEFADDVFLYGTVAALDATVVTSAGVFENAVKMDYLIDYGTSILTDPTGITLGTFGSETTGHVHFAPDIGPVDLYEEFIPFTWLDCDGEDCPPEYVALVGVVVQTITMSLATGPSPVVAGSWASIKALFR
jgi:hypothetical protein